MIYSIQYMRAIAALLVVIHHAAWKGAQYSSDPLSWFNIGGVGVDLFFIISGYIMCYTVQDKPIKVIRFLKARVIRIIPLYWFLTTLALVIFIFIPEKVNSSGGNTNIIASYLLLPSGDKYLIQNGWTLSYEFLFYVIFSLCLTVKYKYNYFVPVGLISLLVLLGNANLNIYGFDFFTNSLLFEFTFGILAFHISRYFSYSNLNGSFLIFFSILSFFCIDSLDFECSRVISYGLPAFVFFLGMLQMEIFFKVNHSNIMFKSLKKIGDSSYSLYLFHPFSLVLFSLVFSYLGLNDYGVAFVSMLVLTSIITGHFCYLFLELNLAKVVRKLRN